MIEPSTDPLVSSIEVSCSQADAFELWTSRPSSWWPMRDHTTFGEDAVAVVIEPGTGGRLYETNSAGSQREWGRVTSWDPPRSLAFTWHIYGAANEATDVEVSFETVSDERTLVRIVHTGWERLGKRATELRAGNEAGWRDLLQAFESAVNRHADGR